MTLREWIDLAVGVATLACLVGMTVMLWRVILRRGEGGDGEDWL